MVPLLVAATVATGLFAGVFAFYAHTVMPALRQVDDRTFVSTYALLDQRIVNPVFLVSTFLGAPVLTGAAAIVAWGEDPFGWTLAAFLLQAATVVISGRTHLPRNDRLKAAAVSPDRDDATIRATFDEGGWVRWNLVRVATSGGALAALAVALTVTP